MHVTRKPGAGVSSVLELSAAMMQHPTYFDIVVLF